MMKRLNKISFLNIIATFVFVFLFISGKSVVVAEHKLEDLHIHVQVHENGDATITETRQAILSEGTENYIVIGNLGKSTIKDFIVSEGDKTYEFVDNWNLDATREEKAFKNGIIKTSNHYELSWGIGDYGFHEYRLQYTVTNFIKQLEDSQVLFWRFVNDDTNIPPEHVTVEIEANKKLNQNDEAIWGFGFEGDIQFSNGKVVAESNRPLSRSDYVTILVKFADGQFGTEDKINKSFEEVQDEAFEGSDYGKEGSSSSLFEQFQSVFILVILIGFIFYRRIFKNSDPLKRGKKKFVRKFDGEYYRDIPYDGPFTDPHYILSNIGATNFDQMLSAFILKWINEDRISVETEEKGVIKKRNIATFYIKNKAFNKNTFEGRLFSLFLNAADKYGKVNEQRFSKSVTKNISSYNRWERDVHSNSYRLMKQYRYISEKEDRKFIIKRKTSELTKKGKQLEDNIYKYVNYLHDFSLLNEHEPINVKLWDNIMIWAAVLGLTEVVYEQFKRLYPKYEVESSYSPVTISAVRSYSRRAAKAREERVRSSGGGGYTSMGGGGGSFGGGSGGGTR